MAETLGSVEDSLIASGCQMNSSARTVCIQTAPNQVSMLHKDAAMPQNTPLYEARGVAAWQALYIRHGGQCRILSRTHSFSVYFIPE